MSKSTKKRVTAAILGCMGVPAQYGGFETLAENLVFYHREKKPDVDLTVYCSSVSYDEKADKFESAALRYIPLNANGKPAMFYDMWSLIDATIRGTDVVILLGHGGSFIIPLLKLVSSTKFITNIDGIEWRREKWSGLAKAIIRKSEAFAIRFSHEVIADNDAIKEYVDDEFGRSCVVIPYGGDHALGAIPALSTIVDLPDSYALALCRIEPENNVEMILEAFSSLDKSLVFVGNWEKSGYGRGLKARYKNFPNIIIHDPVYEPSALRAIRDKASIYVHGHSAGGTNPSLVEMMHFGIPIAAHGCSFNRFSTEDKATYFLNADELVEAIEGLDNQMSQNIGQAMKEIADRRYTWDQVGKAYFELMEVQR